MRRVPVLRRHRGRWQGRGVTGRVGRATWTGIGLALALVGCGTTVPGASSASSGGGLAGASLTGPDGVAPKPPGGASGPAFGPLSGAGNGEGAGSANGAATNGSAASAGSGPFGPGITRASISVGLAYAKNTQQEQAALGNTVDLGDPYQFQQVMVNYLNKHGGIAGRKISPVWYSQDATTTQTTAQISQAVCADFTQDHHVFAALGFGAGAGSRNLETCMQKAGAVVGLASNVAVATTADYDAFPANYEVGAIALDRLCANLIPTLVDANYFTAWDTTNAQPGTLPVKVGVLAPDLPPFHYAITHICLPLLARAGHPVSASDVYFYYFPDSTSGNGQAVADIQNAELKFRTDGVTHVLPIEVNGQVFFGKDADSQHYYPRYGVNTADGTQAENGSFLTPKQLNGAVGLGYIPSFDLTAQMDPDNGPYSSPERRQCVAIMEAGGQTFGSTTAEGNALSYCDLFFQLKRVIEHIPTGQPISQATFIASLDTIGQVPSAGIPAAFYGRHHLDPMTEGWRWQYFANCTCMHYTGHPFHLR